MWEGESHRLRQASKAQAVAFFHCIPRSAEFTQCILERERRSDLGAIFTNEGHRNLRAAEAKASKGLGRLYESICPICARLLEISGRCAGCGRTFDPPPLDLNALPPQQRAEAIKQGFVDAGTPGLTANEAKQVNFYARARREKTEREQAAAKPRTDSREPSLSERAKRFIGRDGLPIAMG